MQAILTEPTTMLTPQRVVELLREQARLYGELESLAAKQRILVAIEDSGALLAVLADRQRLASSLQVIGDNIEPVRRTWSSFRERLNASQRAEVEDLLARIGQRIRRLIEGDERDVRLLSARREGTARAMRGAHAAGEAILAYRVPPIGPGRPRSLDLGPA